MLGAAEDAGEGGVIVTDTWYLMFEAVALSNH